MGGGYVWRGSSQGGGRYSHSTRESQAVQPGKKHDAIRGKVRQVPNIYIEEWGITAPLDDASAS